MYSKKKNYQVHIKLTTEEGIKLRERAKLFHMSVQSYCEYVLINAKVKLDVEL